MNISKFIAKLVLAFFVFSSVQSSIFAVGEPDNRAKGLKKWGFFTVCSTVLAIAAHRNPMPGDNAPNYAIAFMLTGAAICHGFKFLKKLGRAL